MHIHAAYMILDLDHTKQYTRVEITDKLKQLRSKHHPDKGGDVDAFRSVIDAYETAMKHLEGLVNCPECKGKGKYHKTKGFYAVYSACQTCKGKGRLTRESRLQFVTKKV